MADWEMDHDYLAVRTTETHMGPSPHIRSVSGEALSPEILSVVMAAPFQTAEKENFALIKRAIVYKCLFLDGVWIKNKTCHAFGVATFSVRINPVFLSLKP